MPPTIRLATRTEARWDWTRHVFRVVNDGPGRVCRRLERQGEPLGLLPGSEKSCIKPSGARNSKGRGRWCRPPRKQDAMATSQMSEVIQHLRRTVLLRDGAGLTDGQLLEDYLSRRDEAALAALVRRHGPMVWGVCRRVLGNHHDAEDAFQASFLVLVRKAASIVPRQMVANWLYGVAHQTALNARAAAAKRKGRERQVTEMPEPAVADQHLWDDLQPLLDAELSRLPDKYRAVIILCDLEGKTRKEAARQIGVPEGTVAGRLARARAMLAKRLARHGLAISGGALAAVLSQKVASATVPLAVVESTIKAASLVAAGAGAISVKVAALTEGAMKAMLFTRLKSALAVVLILGFAATGATFLTCRSAAVQDYNKRTAGKPVKPKAELAWGKAVDGLQLGLSFVHPAGTAYHPGDVMRFVVKVRNVSKAPIAISYGLPESEPEITTARGKKVYAVMPPIHGFIVIPTEKVLKPGETVALYEREVAVRGILEEKAAQKTEVSIPTIRVGAGTYKIAFSDFVQRHLVLSTGVVEFKVKGTKNSPEEKEAFTAWGKEVGGVQAGLGFRPGERRAYQTGETVRLVVRVRNVGNKKVKVAYFNEFFYENPPRVTDGDGKLVPLEGIELSGLPVLVERSLAPGKEITLCEMHLKLQPASMKGKERQVWSLFGAGKFKLRHENVGGGNIGTRAIKFDPVLNKLATGKLDLEVKDAENRRVQQEKQACTAWGKEVGGLQAGLGFRPGEMRAYHHGEAVTLVVRLRNIGKKTVKFSYLMPYIEHEPIVTSSDGKRVPQPTKLYEIGARLPGQVELPPGKVIEIHELKRELKPASESGSKRPRPEGRPHALYGTGKVSIQYEQVLGDPAMGYPKWKLDPTLGKLATGKLDLEIPADPPAE